MGSITERRGKNGQISFRARVRRKGNRTHTASFQSRQEAREWIKLTEADIIHTRYYPHEQSRIRQEYTLGEVIERYLKSIMPLKKQKTQIHQIQQLNWWKAQIGHLYLDKITPSLIAEYRDKLRNSNKGAASTVRRYLFALSHVFTICIKEWQILESNPVMKISKPREPRGRVRFLSKEELDQLYTACEHSPTKHLLPIVMLAICTGGRKGEILNLKRGNIDFLTNSVGYFDTKNDERRVIHFGETLRSLLLDYVQEMLISPTNLLFPSQNGRKPADIRGAWEAARKKAGLVDFRFRDLRHTFASYLAMNGASLLEIAELLGHKKLEMVKRYAHLTQDHKAQVVERMTRSLFNGS